MIPAVKYFLFFFSMLKIDHMIGISTIGIDLGCDLIKIGIAKPSLRISLAADEFGERLISTAIYINEDYTVFGTSALDMLSSDPHNVYVHLPCLVGRHLNDKATMDYISQFPYYNIKEDPLTESLYFVNKKNETFYVDELVALILDNAMKLATESIEKMYPNRFLQDIAFDSRSSVILVPNYYQQRHRNIALNICKMANITVLQLLDTSTASFITLATTYLKRNSTDGIYGILDIGAHNIYMTIAHIEKEKSLFRSHSFDSAKFKILSSSLQSNVGVHTVLRKMQRYFVDEIKSEYLINKIVDIACPKFISKLYIGCRKLLLGLRHSETADVTIKRLFNNMDYKISMNSTIFLKLVSETLESVTNIIQKTFRSIPGFWLIPKGVAVIGGGRYLPFVDDAIKRSFKKVPYLKVLDSLYNNAWGAVYRATNIMPGIFNFPIKIPKKWYKYIKIRIAMNKKIEEVELNFKKQDDILVAVKLFRNLRNNFHFSTIYKPISVNNIESTHSNIAEIVNVHDVVVNNLKETINKIILMNQPDKDADNFIPQFSYKSVKVIYQMDIHATINLQSVEAVFVKKTLIDMKALMDSEDLLNTSRKIVINETMLELIVIPLNYTIIPQYKVMSPNQLDQMISRINNMKLKTKEYFQTAAVRNELEFFITDIMRKFNEKDYIICTSDIEKRMIWSFLDDLKRWMKSVKLKSVTKAEYFSKFDHLINLTGNIEMRVHEIRNRPILMKKLQSLLDSTQHFIMNMFVTSGSSKHSKGIFTKNETNLLRVLNKETRIWFSNVSDKVKNLKPENDPPVLCDNIIEKIVILENHHKNLLTLMDKRMDPNQQDQSGKHNVQIENLSNQTASIVDKNTNQGDADGRESQNGYIPASDNNTVAHSDKETLSQCVQSDKDKDTCASKDKVNDASGISP